MRNGSIKLVISFGIVLLLLGLSFNTSTALSNSDTTPPVTLIFFDPQDPDGEAGWYVSNVTITLIATDDISGVNVTYYRINNDEWTVYEDPFIILKEGDDISIEFYSIDNVGNQEDVKQVTIDLDKYYPFINISYKIVFDTDEMSWYLQFTLYAIDSMSGMNRVEFYFNNEIQETVTGSGPEYVWTLFYWPLPINHIRATAFDNAGNYAEAYLNLSDFYHKIKIKGPRLGRSGIDYNYKFKINDPDGNDFLFFVDWGDGSSTDWIGPYESEVFVILNHTWPKNGTYKIRVLAKDFNETECGDGSFSTIISRVKVINTPRYLFLKRFIFLEKLINYINMRLF
jgi:hypothetical protein